MKKRIIRFRQVAYVGCLLIGITQCLSFARIGDSLEQLRDRYGRPKSLMEKDKELTIVEYEKEDLFLEFTLLDQKTEGVRVTGKLNQQEADVFLSRNCSVEKSSDFLTHTPKSQSKVFHFWKSYSFPDGSRADFFSMANGWEDYATLVIESAKMRANQNLKKDTEDNTAMNEAEKRVDRIESKEPGLDRGKKVIRKLVPEGSSLREYQEKLYSSIGSRWNLQIQQRMAQVGVDRVVIRFEVNPDGSITGLDVIEGNPNSMLSVVSSDSIQQSSNLIGPFPPALLKEKPDGFSWELVFKIY